MELAPAAVVVAQQEREATNKTDRETHGAAHL